MSIWHKHLHKLITNPGDNGSDYREQALWMKALLEVNRAAYEKLVAAWRLTHRRRRNLWSEMAAVGLPVG